MRIGSTEITTISTTADTIRYNIEVIYDPAVPRDTVEESVLGALDEFKTSLSFNAMFYPQRLIDAVMAADGVVTVHAVSMEHKTSADEDFEQVGIQVELAAGYFDYDDKNTITLTSMHE